VGLRIWLYQHGGLRLSWTLYQVGNDHFVRRVVVDGQGASTADEAPISEQSVADIRKWLGRTQVPPFPERWFVVNDSDLRGLVVCNPYVKSRYTWLGPAPKGWKPLALWHERTIFGLEQRLPPPEFPFEVQLDHTIHD